MRISRVVGIAIMAVGVSFAGLSADAQLSKGVKAAIVVGRGVKGMSRIKPVAVPSRNITPPRPVILPKPPDIDSMRIRMPAIPQLSQDSLRKPWEHVEALNELHNVHAPHCENDTVPMVNNQGI